MNRANTTEAGGRVRPNTMQEAGPSMPSSPVCSAPSSPSLPSSPSIPSFRVSSPALLSPPQTPFPFFQKPEASNRAAPQPAKVRRPSGWHGHACSVRQKFTATRGGAEAPRTVGRPVSPGREVSLHISLRRTSRHRRTTPAVASPAFPLTRLMAPFKQTVQPTVCRSFSRQNLADLCRSTAATLHIRA